MKLVIALSFTAAALAQTVSPVNSVNSGALGGVVGPTGGGSFSFATNGPWMPAGGSTGAPYSAEEITEHVQTLADGTRITQSPQKTTFYRDSQGRTRTERTFPLPPGLAAASAGPNIIEIFDPVSGAHYSLDPRNRTARKMSFPTIPPPPPPAATAMISPPPPPVQDAQRQRPQTSRESLGTQTIEGVLAQGTRMTTVYPIDSVGNDRPITVVRETWMSPELRTQVLSKTSDPRNGDSTTRLTSISRAEPDPSLFQIPSDYQVIEEQAARRP